MRQEWTDTVSRTLRGVVSRRTGVALGLWGAPGMGKSHTASAVLRDLPCASVSLPASSPVAAFIDALPLPRRWPLWAQRHLERLLAGEPTGDAALVDTLVAALGGLAPFVLHLDDLHDADPQRTALIVSLAHAVQRSRGIAVMVSGRHEPPAPFAAFQLPALEETEAQALLRDLLNMRLPPEALTWLQERTRGNPLFLLEFTRYLTRHGALWSDGERWHWRPPPAGFLPVTVEALIARHLGDLGRDDAVRHVIEARALLGDVLAGSALDEVWATVAQVPASTVTGGRGILRRAGVLGNRDFSHPLYREVTLAGLTPERRRDLARRAFAALADAPLLAAHFVEAAGLEPDTALAAYRRAAHAADTAGRPAEATRFLAAAVAHAGGETRLALAVAAAAGLRRHDLPEALRLGQLALEAAPQHPEALTLVAELLAQQGRLAEAEAVLNRWPEPGRSSAAWVERLLTLRGLADDQPGVLALWEGHAGLREHTPPAVAATVARTLGQQGRMTEAAALVNSALEAPALAPELRIGLIEVLGNIQYGRGDIAAAAETYRQALALAQAAGLRHLEARNHMHVGVALGDANRRREGLAALAEGLRLHTELGDGLAVTRTQVALAEAWLDLGDYERAEGLLLECRTTLSRRQPTEFLIECEYRLSALYRDWHPPHGGVLALRHAHAALAHARQITGERKVAWALCHAALAEARFGRAATALALAAEAREIAARLGNPTQIGYATLAWALAREAHGQPQLAGALLETLEAELSAQGNLDAAHEVGLQADRIAGRADRAAGRLAWFERHDLGNLARLTRRAFPELSALDTAPAPPAREPAPPLCVKVLGPVVVERDGQRLHYRGRRRSELLAYLLEARLSGRAEASTLELLETFYPDDPEAQARATLRQQIYLIRGQLGAHSVHSTPSGYALGDIGSDAETFLATGDPGLWRGPYLQGLGEGWLPRAREALTLALRAQTERHLPAAPAEAARLGQILLELEPYDEPALRVTLSALRACGQPRSAAALYRQQRERLAEVGHRLPESPEAFLTASERG
ncbi:AAA family ATPase [Deinococcus rufus]|uniref:AAA family ATPase n=2 Tax=Deinococcus TaxID=1298 RepID=A0ABV7ZBH9_9DEIO